jgi:hypothetical protein
MNTTMLQPFFFIALFIPFVILVAYEEIIKWLQN